MSMDHAAIWRLDNNNKQPSSLLLHVLVDCSTQAQLVRSYHLPACRLLDGVRVLLAVRELVAGRSSDHMRRRAVYS